MNPIQKNNVERMDVRQSYYLNQRNIVLNSNDRNERIWPNANHFEITLPMRIKMSKVLKSQILYYLDLLRAHSL